MGAAVETQDLASVGRPGLAGERVVVVDSDREAAWELGNELHVLTGCEAVVASTPAGARDTFSNVRPALVFLTVGAAADGRRVVLVLRTRTPASGAGNSSFELARVMEWPVDPARFVEWFASESSCPAT